VPQGCWCRAWRPGAAETSRRAALALVIADSSLAVARRGDFCTAATLRNADLSAQSAGQPLPKLPLSMLT
jgi:hypothetical protein